MWKRGGTEKSNCWETKKCGREPGGIHAGEEGICPAALEKGLEGVHGGKSAGRACWVIAGTFCRGQVQGVFAKEYTTCRECDFFKKVKMEEGFDFQTSDSLLRKLDEICQRQPA